LVGGEGSIMRVEDLRRVGYFSKSKTCRNIGLLSCVYFAFVVSYKFCLPLLLL